MLVQDFKTIFIKEIDSSNEFYISKLRSIYYLLGNIESLHKMFLIDYELVDTYKDFSEQIKKKIYNEKDKIVIKKFVKNSPLEIELIVNHLSITFEIFSILLEIQEDKNENIKMTIENLIGKNINDDKWKKMIYKMHEINRILRILNLSLNFN